MTDANAAYRVNFLFSTGSPLAALYLRYTNSSNYYTAQLTLAGVLTVSKTVGGGQAVLGTATVSSRFTAAHPCRCRCWWRCWCA